jgi:zinc protease
MQNKHMLQPEISASALPVLTNPELIMLPNGIKLYVLELGDLDILKMEVIIEASRPHEWKKLTARCTSKMIREGNRSYTAEAFAEHIDFYGATLSVPSHMDIASFQLFTIKKHAAQLIPAVAEAIRYPAFGKKELNTFTQNAIAELTIELGKAETLAYRKFTEFLYGADHPYGYNSTAEMYRAIDIEDLHEFHKGRYHPHLTSIILSGKITKEVVQIVEDAFGSWTSLLSDERKIDLPKAPILPPQNIKIPLKNSDQAAIKLGRRLFNRHHPDYIGMGLLNTILGGYFGSRLMTNIREKKGYTYNIYSSFDILRGDGYFYIASEVNKRKTKAALQEIKLEVEKLRNEPIPEAELQMVKNYISGMMLLAVDGPLNQSNLLRSLVIDGMSITEFDAEMAQLSGITTQHLHQLAQRWLDPESFWQVIV